MAGSSAYIISYDISDKKRLRQMHKLISGQAQRLQLSVYYHECTKAQIKDLLSDIEAIIEPTEDDVRIYPSTHMDNYEWFGHLIKDNGLLLIN